MGRLTEADTQRHPQLRIGDFVGAKFYCPHHALADRFE